jgi:hypothetical protein
MGGRLRRPGGHRALGAPLARRARRWRLGRRAAADLHRRPGERRARRRGAARDRAPRSRSRTIFHVYAVDWTADRVTWSLDGAPYSTLARAELPARAWAVDHDCYLLLNLAIGGAWPGNAFDPAVLPATLLVDWVRVRSPRIIVAAS